MRSASWRAPITGVHGVRGGALADLLRGLARDLDQLGEREAEQFVIFKALVFPSGNRKQPSLFRLLEVYEKVYEKVHAKHLQGRPARRRHRL